MIIQNEDDFNRWKKIWEDAGFDMQDDVWNENLIGREQYLPTVNLNKQEGNGQLRLVSSGHITGHARDDKWTFIID